MVNCDEDLRDALEKLTDKQLTFTRDELASLLLATATNASHATEALLRVGLEMEDYSLTIPEGMIRATASAVRGLAGGEDANETGFYAWLDTLGKPAAAN